MRTICRSAGSLPVQSTLSLSVLALLWSGHIAVAQTVIPTDAFPTCTVAPDEFKTWFNDGNVTKDGLVKPADSVAFNPTAACSFYKWSEQMFLWMTSQRPPGGGSHVFSSPLFYAVEAVGGGARKLRPQKDNTLPNFAPNISLLGGAGQEVVFDSTGKVHNIIRPQAGANNNLLFRNKLNEMVAVSRVATSVSGKPLLLDKTEKVLDVKEAPDGAPLLEDASGKAITLRNATVLVDNEPRLVTTDGDVVELGQAGGRNDAVLMAQNGSLVYYLIQVNDVFAYFKTGEANTGLTPAPTEFPTTADQLDGIVKFASKAPAPNTMTSFADGNALAIEVKSSWIEATNLNKNDYVIIHATVPNFIPDGSSKLILGTPKVKDVDLALVGFHVVGSMAGHPEMTWATFEHINNSPNLPYSYVSKSGATIIQPADGAGPWLFSSKGAEAASITPRLKLNTVTQTEINAVGPASPSPTIGPSDVTRLVPWGTVSPDPNTVLINNNDMISINANIKDMLPAGDVRRNYMMIGAIWTDGQPPTVDVDPPTGPSNHRGTPTVANSTMETFQPNSNCFGCHVGNMLGTSAGRGLSHIYGQITPLFPKQP
jgi:hypothetical protein